jgi:hypothetical protein
MKIADFLWPRSIAAEGPGSIALFDTRPWSAESLAARLRQYYPALRVAIRDNDPAGYDLLVNATAASSRAITSSGTESLLTLCWRGESRANQSLKVGFSGAGELRPDSETFMDDTRKRKGAIFGPDQPEFWFCPSADFSGDVVLSY